MADPVQRMREMRVLANLDKMHSELRKAVKQLRKKGDLDDPEVRDLFEKGQQLEEGCVSRAQAG